MKEPTSRTSLRWTLIMAILGLILGLGFMIPLSPNDLRAPASSASADSIAFVEPKWKLDTRPNPRPNQSSATQSGVAVQTTRADDPREDVLFDAHTVSRSSYAKNTDAYVTTRFVDAARSAIDRFTYCHNYDFSKQQARSELNRYSLQSDGFNCYSIDLEWLASGATIIDTILGPVLALKSAPGFDPKKGGIVSLIFAYRIAKITANDYRAIDLHLSMANGVLTVRGPNGESFDWINLKMTEDIFNFPSGLNSFEFYNHGVHTATLPGKNFRKAADPRK